MTGENYSVTKCTLNKKAGDQLVDLIISNQNEENEYTLNLKAVDQQSEASLTIYVDGVQSDQVTVEPKSAKTIQIDLTHANHVYELELSRGSSGGGISIRQSNSSSDRGKKNLVEVVLR